MGYAEKLKTVRKMRNETQKQFGERIGYTQSWVSQMERGMKSIPLSLRQLIDYMMKDAD
jgi:transcriptional regulator with XRE-family HTH domain